jgi:hypothetical protein
MKKKKKNFTNNACGGYSLSAKWPTLIARGGLGSYTINRAVYCIKTTQSSSPNENFQFAQSVEK